MSQAHSMSQNFLKWKFKNFRMMLSLRTFYVREIKINNKGLENELKTLVPLDFRRVFQIDYQS